MRKGLNRPGAQGPILEHRMKGCSRGSPADSWVRLEYSSCFACARGLNRMGTADSSCTPLTLGHELQRKPAVYQLLPDAHQVQIVLERLGLALASSRASRRSWADSVADGYQTTRHRDGYRRPVGGNRTGPRRRTTGVDEKGRELVKEQFAGGWGGEDGLPVVPTTGRELERATCSVATPPPPHPLPPGQRASTLT